MARLTETAGEGAPEGLPQGQTYPAWGLPFKWEPCGPPPPSHSGAHTSQSDTKDLGQAMKKGLVPGWGLHSRSVSLGPPSLESSGHLALCAGLSGLGATSLGSQSDLEQEKEEGKFKAQHTGSVEQASFPLG